LHTKTKTILSKINVSIFFILFSNNYILPPLEDITIRLLYKNISYFSIKVLLYNCYL
jgi:hypothetical protein